MEEKKDSKTSKTTTSKATTKAAPKNTSKTTTSTKKKSTRKKKVEEVEELEEFENFVEDESVAEQIKRRRKIDEKSFNTGLSPGAKIAIVIVIAVIVTLFCLKGCKNKSEYTVKFNTNGGTEVSEQVVSANSKVSLPKDPIKEGYNFVGWYLDGKRFDFDSKITSDLVIEAKWESTGTADVTGVTLDQKEVAILPGDTIPLIATVEPSDARNKDVTWSSSDESVVTVDDKGMITAKSIGSATITVTTNEKNYTAECRVVVSDSVVKVTGISLDKTELKLAVGEAERVNATVTPSNATNKGVTWSSSDSSVASVSSTGVVRAVDEGEATITASTKDGNYEATVKVKIEKISVESLRVEDITILVGETANLTYKILPNNAADKTVTWKSTDTTVVTINDKGEVTGIKTGKVKIIGTTKDGEKKGEAWVTVTKPVAVTGITFTGCPTKPLEIGQTAQLTVTVSPNNAVEKHYVWSNSDSSVATISNGKITAKKEGSTIISAKTDDGGFVAKCEVTVVSKSVTKTYTYSVKENGSDYEINVYENGTDITSQVSSFNGKETNNESPIHISEHEKENLDSSVEIIVNGEKKTATRK